ncbi:MAG: glycerophosphodiester phosphodiesterase [Microcella pacifica]
MRARGTAAHGAARASRPSANSCRCCSAPPRVRSSSSRECGPRRASRRSRRRSTGTACRIASWSAASRRRPSWSFWRAAPSLARAAVVRRLPADPVLFAERVGASTVVTSLRSFEVEPHAVDALHEAGITVVVYTLNNPRLWERAIALGVDAVVTDAPRRHAHWQPAPADA